MRKVIQLSIAVAFLSLLPRTNAQLIFTMSLDSTGTGVVSSGRGSGYAVMSSDFKSLTYQVTVNKLQAAITAAHFHISPSTAIVQPITFTGNTASGTWTNIPDSLLKYFFGGSKGLSVYINVHTSVGPGGEIRSNLQPHQSGFSVQLDSTKEGSGSNGKGSGWVTFEDSSGVRALRYQFTYSGLNKPIAASHFHVLPSTSIVKPITFVDSTSSGFWTNYPDSIVTLILRGNTYVNIHTSFAPGGEIRGTPTFVGEIPFYARLDSAQAGTSSNGRGAAWAILTNDLSKLRYSVTFARLTGTYAGSHFHHSPSGSIVQAITPTGNSAAADWTGLTDANIQDLVLGRIYVNIHSSTYPGGDIRGNLIRDDGVFTAKLNGAQAGTNSTASGTGFLYFDNDTIKYVIAVAGLSSTLTGAHVHYTPGGSILQPTPFTDSIAVGKWAYPPADSIVVLLVKGRLYFNVHSTNFPGGEIRGNIGIGSVAVTGVEQTSSDIPSSFALGQNYPNPFNPSTTISFSIAKSSRTVLRVFNLLGQEVARLIDELKGAGSYKVTFDARRLSTGMYFYRLELDGRVADTKKMVLLK